MARDHGRKIGVHRIRYGARVNHQGALVREGRAAVR